MTHNRTGTLRSACQSVFLVEASPQDKKKTRCFSGDFAARKESEHYPTITGNHAKVSADLLIILEEKE
ncbi:MAG: hypothetical protein WC292_00365 [Clostridia bacterium]